MRLRKKLTVISLIATCIIGAVMQAEVFGRTRNVSADSISNGPKPRPENGVTALLHAFGRFRIVALGEAHPLQDEHEFILDLIRDPAFPEMATDIVVEFGNARYQDLVDKYVSGANVSLDELKVTWQNTTQPMAWDADCYPTFFTAVREVNQRLPPAKRLRVVLADPPIDWDAVHSLDDYFGWLLQRETSIGQVTIREVLEKPNRRALMIFGSLHLIRQSSSNPFPNATGQIEQRYPGSVFVVVPHLGFGRRNDELEPRLESWNKNSLALVRNTWLGRLDPNLVIPVFIIGPDGNPVNPFEGMQLEDVIDGYLYVGRKSDLSKSNVYPYIYRDAYWDELNRRNTILFGSPLDPKGEDFNLSVRFWNLNDPLLPAPSVKK